MNIGVDYYPEHWSRARWKTDADMMKKAGFNIVRMAEFAWAFMEPREGVFDFDWLDEILEILDKRGIKAILGTPTAVMPAWVARRYPECLAMKADGTRIVWGVRKNNCFSVPKYHRLSERITGAMARHFKNTPNVIGWQTDNEFGDPPCYCTSCQTTFQAWLKTRYSSLEGLNKAWGTHFWGHCYSAWDQVSLPAAMDAHNPGMCLDWKRFNSHLNVRFQHGQVEILRKICPNHFVTHNFMGLFSGLDYYDLARDLDFVSWDNYPVWGAPSIPYDAASGADVMRGLKKKNFWIMEQTAGPGGWSAFGRNPRPGEIRKIAFQQVAHGADAMIWFRWRSCTAGREQYWHGLLGHEGKPNRRYREASQTAGELHRLAPVLTGTTVKAEVAMIYDYESHWAVQIQPGYAKNVYHDAMRRYQNALFRAGINIDMISPKAAFDGYRLIIAPDLMLMPDPLANKLNRYIQKGGVFLMDCRSGVKDGTNLCHARTLPGLLSDAMGVAIEEYEALDETMAYPVTGSGPMRGAFNAVHYADWTIARGAEILARYDQWHVNSCAALTRNRFGKGTAFYLGTVVRESSFYDQLISLLLKTAMVKPIIKPPPGVEVSVRQSHGRQLLFIMNHTEERQSVVIPAGRKELITGRTTSSRWSLDPYGVAVLS